MINIEKERAVGEWDLSTIYDSFESPAFLIDFAESERILDHISNELQVEDSFTRIDLLDLFHSFNHGSMLIHTLSTYITLSAMVENRAPALSVYQERIMVLNSRFRTFFSELKHKVSTIPDFTLLIDENPDLALYTHFITESKRLASHRMSSDMETLVSQLQRSGSRSWQSLRDTLDGNASAILGMDGEEKTLTLAGVRSLGTDPNPTIRKNAYMAELKGYRSYEDSMAACLNGIKGEAITLNRCRGYKNVLEEMLDVNQMDSQTLEAMMASVESHLGLFQSYLKKKAEILGYEKGLPWFELLAPLEKKPYRFEWAEGRNLIETLFENFDFQYGAYIKRAFRENWMDWSIRPGKASGALCADFPILEQSRIFTQFTGGVHDLRVLAHELGHGFHARCLDGIPHLLRDAPTPICETASIFNETLLLEHLVRTADLENKRGIIEIRLQEATHTILDIYSRFLFEKEVFRRRESELLSSQDLCEIMKCAQLQAYGDSLDPEYLHPYMWMCKVHYYIPDFHYYNFPYTFGLLLANSLYDIYEKNPMDFPEKYKHFLANTCTMNLYEMGKSIHMDFHEISFWDRAFQKYEIDIQEFCSETSKS